MQQNKQKNTTKKKKKQPAWTKSRALVAITTGEKKITLLKFMPLSE